MIFVIVLDIPEAEKDWKKKYSMSTKPDLPVYPYEKIM